MATYRFISVFFCCFLLLTNNASGKQPTDPLNIIKSSNDRILTIYQNSERIDPQIQKNIFSVMEEVTDFNTIGERATEGFCGKSSRKTCTEFKKTFVALLKINGLRKLGNYRADRFDYYGQEIDGKTAKIKALAYYKDDSIELDYILEKGDRGWLIVNYITDGIDTIRNYRRQFARILRKDSLENLVNRLKRKITEYRQEAEE